MERKSQRIWKKEITCHPGQWLTWIHILNVLTMMSFIYLDMNDLLTFTLHDNRNVLKHLSCLLVTGFGIASAAFFTESWVIVIGPLPVFSYEMVTMMICFDLWDIMGFELILIAPQLCSCLNSVVVSNFWLVNSSPMRHSHVISWVGVLSAMYFALVKERELILIIF